MVNIQRTTIGTKVLTPSYWQEEEYQPLIQVKTAFGNTVQIPKFCQDIWELYQRQKDFLLNRYLQKAADGFFRTALYPRQKIGSDIRKVFFEVYKE